MRRLAPILLTWILSTAPWCQPAAIRVYDAYITGAKIGDGSSPESPLGEPIAPGSYTEGYRLLPPTQTSFQLAYYKPHVGCVVAWQVEAVDAQGSPLDAICQPTGLQADGASWEGM